MDKRVSIRSRIEVTKKQVTAHASASTTEKTRVLDTARQRKDLNRDHARYQLRVRLVQLPHEKTLHHSQGPAD
jgi:hypothetical protein